VADEADSGQVRYDRLSIVLHWATALLVVSLWVLGQLIDDFPRGAPRVVARSVHITLGVTLIFVLLARVAWRTSAGRRLPPAHQGWPGYLARSVHVGLYILVAAALVLGVANVWVRGDSYFGLFSVPKFDPGNDHLKDTVEDLHSTLANTVLIVAGLHAAMALVHHFVLRNGVLRRMLPGASAK
jgi:cytochrome b561